MYRRKFLPASALKQPCQSCLCVAKSHSQRAFYPPRLKGPWHWQRRHTQRHIHKHNLHAWCNVQSLEQTDTFGYTKQHCSVSALISEIVLLHLCSSSSWVVYYTIRGKVLLLNCCTAELLFEYCLILIFFSISYCSSRNCVWQQELSHWRPI